MKRLLALSALVASGALCVGLAVSQVLSTAPTATASTVTTPPPTPTAAASAPAVTPGVPRTTLAGAIAPVAATAPALPPSAGAPGANGLPALFPPQGAVPALGAVTTPPMKRAASYRSVEVDGPYIALTFDDGPSPETTPKLLKILAERNIKATFFVLGTHATANPDILRSQIAAGHEVGNHSWNHPQLTKIKLEAADKQIEDTSAAIQNATGVKPIYLRPPYGSMTPALQHHISEKYGISTIYWSVDPLDWKIRDPQSVYDQIMKQVKPGAIVLAHDIHATTVAAMPRLLDALIAKGYKFVTVSELIAMEKPATAKVASATPVAAPAPAPVKKKPQAQSPSQSQSPQRPKPPAAVSSSGRDANNYGLY